MRQIWKYVLPVQDYVTVEMPQSAAVVHVAEQHGHICMWALVFPEHKPVTRKFRIAGTGHNLTEEFLSYLGTVHLAGGDLVFHVFEVMADCGPNRSIE